MLFIFNILNLMESSLLSNLKHPTHLPFYHRRDGVLKKLMKRTPLVLPVPKMVMETTEAAVFVRGLQLNAVFRGSISPNRVGKKPSRI